MNPNPFGFASTNTTTGFIGNGTVPEQRASPRGCRRTSSWRTRTSSVGTANGSFSGANLTTNFGGTHANSVQMEFRKRLSNGLPVQTSYTWAERVDDRSDMASSKPLEDIVQTGQVGNVQHAVKGELAVRAAVRRGPAVGRQRQRLRQRAASAAGEFDGVGRIQTGEMIDFGNVRLVGMTRGGLPEASRAARRATERRSCSSCRRTSSRTP